MSRDAGSPIKNGEYLVNKPLRKTSMSEDNVRGRKSSRKNKRLAEKPSFEGSCEILRPICQPRALSSDKTASQEGVYLFYNPPINFYNARGLLW